MDQFVIEGRQPLKGTVTPGGNKNAALPLLAACLLTTEPVILRNVPRLTPRNRDRAWRFTTLIDALYEKKVKLICSAEAPPDQLYVEGDGAFEFQRVVSRLMEMQSPDYLGLEHIEE